MSGNSNHNKSRQDHNRPKEAQPACRAATLKGRLTADGMTISLHPEGAPQHGIVILNPDGTYTYVPDEGYCGTDTFTYDILDKRGGVTTATKKLNVDGSG